MTPELLRLRNELFVFDQVESCGTSTAVSVPCMFSLQDRAHFNIETAGNTENVLDVLQRTGVDVLWRDNNSDSKGVALRVPYESFKTADVNPDCSRSGTGADRQLDAAVVGAMGRRHDGH